ncbi:MAG TPA: tRNA (N6-threonylcarbamoyladenosine(37)-N6)-methyltransferase TrmO [Lachnospiraceae bacterium]|nr:tRNA (N6-threonylcarbamoyladenosine(37)-N6)-methyltransferase TrmO [Lachnospiraceae bacterium]
MKIIAKISTDFSGKFGIPRQSGMVEGLEGRIVFEKEYRSFDAVRGLEGFSHIWLLWQFSKTADVAWSPTVRPPKLGGNTRMGVFATRSPFRPNSIGLSCVRLKEIEMSEKFGPVLLVDGVDLADGTPIYDIKPYLPYADCRPDASGGFSDNARQELLEVSIPEHLLEKLPDGKREALRQVLALDPRPSYQEDAERIYGFEFAGYEVRFRVQGKCLTVKEIIS